MAYRHIPVLLAEVSYYLHTRDGTTYVDCTLGGAGHAGAVLASAGPKGQLLGIDKDVAAIVAAGDSLARFSQQITFVQGDFRDLDRILAESGIGQVDGILFDLGVSSGQIDDPSRGFSYSQEGPLDMRMDERGALNAADIVNGYSRDDLAHIIATYGEERWAGRIADFIVERRGGRPFENTLELVDTIKQAIPARARRRGGHPAKRTFQALRIAVNDELGALRNALVDSVKWLRAGGRLVVISYHSLEDRIVKEVFTQLAATCTCPPGMPECRCGQVPKLKILTKRPVRPTAEEVALNPRAESARLRAAERLP